MRRAPSRRSVIASAVGGVVLAGAAVLGSLFLAVFAAVLVVGYVTGHEARRAGRRFRAGEVATRALGFASLNLGGALLRRIFRPAYLFVVYAETDADKRLYFPRWLERMLRPLFPSGLIRFGRFWGLMVAGKVTADALEDSPERLVELMERTRRDFPGVEVIALGGRLPSIAASKGIAVEAPFLHGDRGTLCAMMGAARQQAEVLGRPPAEVTIAVAGGGGFIGRQLVDELAREFHQVIALDPRFAGRRGWQDNVLFTDRPQDVAHVPALLVLTARGDEVAGLVPFLGEGVVIADDTHPEIPEPVRRRLAETGATVLKASVGDERCRILPRIPLFRHDDIPGCMLEALVVTQRGREVLESQSAFDAAAREIGFTTRLAPHMSNGGHRGRSPQAQATSRRKGVGGVERPHAEFPSGAGPAGGP